MICSHSTGARGLGYFHISGLALPASWSGLAGWLGRVTSLPWPVCCQAAVQSPDSLGRVGRAVRAPGLAARCPEQSLSRAVRSAGSCQPALLPSVPLVPPSCPCHSPQHATTMSRVPPRCHQPDPVTHPRCHLPVPTVPPRCHHPAPVTSSNVPPACPHCPSPLSPPCPPQMPPPCPHCAPPRCHPLSPLSLPVPPSCPCHSPQRATTSRLSVRSAASGVHEHAAEQRRHCHLQRNPLCAGEDSPQDQDRR